MKIPSQASTSAEDILPKPRDTAGPALTAAFRMREKLAACGVPIGDPFARVMVDLLVLHSERRKLDPASLFDNAAPTILAAFTGFVPARKRTPGRKTPGVPHLPTAPLSALDGALMQEAARLGLGRGLDEIAILWILVAALVIDHGWEEAQARCASIAARLRSKAGRGSSCKAA